MKVVNENCYKIKSGILDNAKVVEYNERKWLLINIYNEYTEEVEHFLLEELDGKIGSKRISEEKLEQVKELDESECFLKKYKYVVTEENTFEIKEDLKKAGAKWDEYGKYWYFNESNTQFKNEKAYII